MIYNAMNDVYISGTIHKIRTVRLSNVVPVKIVWRPSEDPRETQRRPWRDPLETPSHRLELLE